MMPAPVSNWDVMAGVYEAAGDRGSDLSLMKNLLKVLMQSMLLIF
jgi:hypothetical protein